MPDEPVVTALKYRLRTEYDEPGLIRTEQVIVGRARRPTRRPRCSPSETRTPERYGSANVRVQTWRARSSGPGFEFEKTENTWHCEDEEIDRLTALLLGEARSSGNYALIAADSPLIGMAMLLEQGYVDSDDLVELTSVIAGTPGLIEALAETNLTALVEMRRHQAGLTWLRAVVENPESTEPEIQRVLQDEWWVFGGRYVAPASRRSIVQLDQFDIPLIRSDGGAPCCRNQASQHPQTC